MACGLAARRAVRPGRRKRPLGQPAPEFQLPDADGQRRTAWPSSRTPKLVVVVFLGTECPLARLYAPRLTKLAAEYADRGVRFVGIDSNVQDTPAEIAAYAHEHDLTFPVLNDAGNVVADQFQARPHAGSLRARRRAQGALPGPHRRTYCVRACRKPTTRARDLAVAIDELLAGKPVSEPQLEAVGCHIGRVPKPAAGDVTYSQHIARIFQNRCVECHRAGEIGPFALTSYDEALGWGETIREVVDQGACRPGLPIRNVGHFVERRPAEPRKKKRRSRNGSTPAAPRAIPRICPNRASFSTAGTFPSRTLVLQDGRQALSGAGRRRDRLPALHDRSGLQGRQVDDGLRSADPATARWCTTFSFSCNRRTGSWICCAGSLLAAYAPGSPPRMIDPRAWPSGFRPARRSSCRCTTRRTASRRKTSAALGFMFCDEQRRQAARGERLGRELRVRDSARGRRTTRSRRKHVFADDRLLLSVTPHMHMRGKSFRYEARLSRRHSRDAAERAALGFQLAVDYILAEPKLMPKGTVLHCEAHYDNSADSPTNPDPTKWVRFGEQTWDEMMIGWFTTATLPGQVASARRLRRATLVLPGLRRSRSAGGYRSRNDCSRGAAQPR